MSVKSLQWVREKCGELASSSPPLDWQLNCRLMPNELSELYFEYLLLWRFYSHLARHQYQLCLPICHHGCAIVAGQLESFHYQGERSWQMKEQPPTPSFHFCYLNTSELWCIIFFYQKMSLKWSLCLQFQRSMCANHFFRIGGAALQHLLLWFLLPKWTHRQQTKDPPSCRL